MMPDFLPPVLIRTESILTPSEKIFVPVVTNLMNPSVERFINQTIRQTIDQMRHEQLKYQSGSNPQTTGHFEIKTNERGIVSLTLSNYTYSYPMAHGYTILRALTFDIMTGKLYSLPDLFKPSSPYITIISQQVSEQIIKRQIPLLEPFHSISPNQSYYLADKALVIFFALYEITPYYVGFPMFPISVYSLQSISADPGPLTTLSADIN
ncbi:DUF3298 and DUF4163 domain-containing protein [Brevibacillus daliensis]|uniref:DUF3298 and DUF4163 domain-containing protein n=1 Tax=Brevibacillus daliensis TaxID=2892995 RepID=UPI001E47DD06|nr:DUF3298 and DUF4163 domain-containing protein [Brevibacillus daliensis]